MASKEFYAEITQRFREKGDNRTYVMGTFDNDDFIACLICGLESFNENDIKEKYCGNCKIFHEPIVKEKGNAKFIIEMDCKSAICIIAQIQLASRHPENTGESQKMAESFARQLQEQIVRFFPEHGPILEMGWNADFDIKAN
jgi:ribosomal protein L37E